MFLDAMVVYLTPPVDPGFHRHLLAVNDCYALACDKEPMPARNLCR
jgi:hypothetical protein